MHHLYGMPMLPEAVLDHQQNQETKPEESKLKRSVLRYREYVFHEEVTW